MINSYYAVYLTVYSGIFMPRCYIGSSNITKIKNGYHGTVRSQKYRHIWRDELKNNPNLFKTRILSTHNTRESAFIEEARIQKKFNVIRSDRFINLSIATSNGFFGPSQKGVLKTEEHKLKIAAANIGKKKSKRHIKNLRIAWLRRPATTEAHRKALGDAARGSKNGKAKTFILTSPVGVKFTVKGELRKFCAEHELSASKIFRFKNMGIIPRLNYKNASLADNCQGWQIEENYK